MKNYVITNADLPCKCRVFLEDSGFEPLILPEFDRLPRPVASHPDMLLFFGDTLICHKDYYELARQELDSVLQITKLKLSLSDEPIGDRYPHDVKFNALCVKDYVICKEESVSSLIKDYAKRLKRTLINTNQGYTRCSVCKISENAIISADAKLCSLCSALGIDSLLIRPGHIGIKDYDYGFIGGASGVLDDSVYFCGSLTLHPDGERIAEFCRKHQKLAISLSDEPLLDVGGLILLKK